MEELRSTEALDREIREDARKKADRILRQAEQSAADAEALWRRKLEEDGAALERKHAERTAAMMAETKARLPLDRRRLRAERSERLLRAAMDKTLRALPRDRQLGVLERELAARSAAFPPGEASVRYSFLNGAELSALLGRVFGPGFAPASSEEERLPAAGGLPGLSIAVGRTVVRVSVAAAGEELLREKRAELASALLGMEALDD